MNKSILIAALFTSLFTPAFAEEKNPEDPTKIITKVGAGYTNSKLTFSGSLGLDEARMMNVTVNDDASEWNVGGSWLFDIGILNFSVRKSDYGEGAVNTSYNIGSFIPTSEFNFTPWSWQPFITFGYSYNDGVSVEDGVEKEIQSHSGYIGGFALKPLNDKWTALAFAGTTQGQNDLSSYWGGGGISHRLSDNHSLNVLGIVVDSSIYGDEQRLNINYRYEFN
ncbi:hypothetical protein C9I98_09555 [Photobacterium sanctipauli]|uniref:Porin family protein n=1 Tax=Photobacterium sanctipauli TaxID=1342794 RepID=A0A2T3NVK3_9GAMM|nr:hypothetical protein [Photobacterium sanctipauli]PSW20287.1 hypothetical protein C9I98_09555 [Photobacterium sanctipauli]